MGSPHPPTGVDTEIIAAHIVDAAYHFHTALGPGLLESVYEVCLAYELRKRGLDVRTQLQLAIRYDEIEVEAGLRIDMVVGDLVIVELKAVEALLPLHDAQLLTYLKLSGFRLGILINFNVPRIKNGIKRVIL